MFATSVKGAEAIATWYAIIETVKLNGLEPYFYLRYLLTQLPLYRRDQKDIDVLMPWSLEKDILA